MWTIQALMDIERHGQITGSNDWSIAPKNLPPGSYFESKTKAKYRKLSKVRFNDSYFVFQDSGWGFQETYFSKKHLFTYRIEWTEHRIMVLKPTK